MIKRLNLKSNLNIKKKLTRKNNSLSDPSGALRRSGILDLKPAGGFKW